MTTRECIQNELQRLGITKRYRGYTQVLFAIEMALENEECLQNVTERVYKVVASQCRCDPSCVERNIRTVSCLIWRKNRPLLEQLARGHLVQKPCTAQLLAILSTSLLLAQKSPPRT